jgi:Tol biopolymer transport system component
MPDGRSIIFGAEGGLWRLAIPGSREPEHLSFAGDDGAMPAISPSQSGGPARLVYVRRIGDMNIWRIDTSGPGSIAVSEPAVAVRSTSSDGIATLSPDDRQLAFLSRRAGTPEIWVANTDGTNAVMLTSMGATMTAAPRWSHNRRLIAFQSNLGNQYDIYVIPSEGGLPRNISSDPANDYMPSFSLDDRWIYFASDRLAKKHQIWKVAVGPGNGTPVQITHNGGVGPLEAPDGTFLYYSRAFGGTSSLWRTPTAGGEEEKVLDRVVGNAYALLSQGVYYVDHDAGQTELRFFDFATRRYIVVARNIGDTGSLLSVTRDGRTIVYTRLDVQNDDLMIVENFR